jgi:nucleotide-binding universal stress UspA family protein
MKIKPTSKSGGVLVELGPLEQQIPEQPAPVFRLKKILVPVDFSDCSKKALQYAIPFARQFGAELVLVHIVQPYPAVPEMAPVDVETIQDGKAEIESLRRGIAKDVPTSGSVRTGAPPTEIARAARELDIDLIIISTHGHTGLTHALLGSTAEKVARYAPCPVLIVRESEREFVPGDVVN